MSIKNFFKSFTMQFRATLLIAAAVAGLAASAPASSKTSQASQAGEDAVCGGVVSPFTAFLDYQSGNVAVSSQGILKGIDGLIKDSGANANVQQIISSTTDGLATSLLNGVSNVLYGLSAGIRGATPACKKNMQFCNSELQAARDSVSSGQPEAKDACLQAKYSCGQFYT